MKRIPVYSTAQSFSSLANRIAVNLWYFSSILSVFLTYMQDKTILYFYCITNFSLYIHIHKKIFVCFVIGYTVVGM